MNSNMDDEEIIKIVSQEELEKQRASAIRSLALGVLLMLMAIGGARLRFLGIALSLGTLIHGARELFSNESRNKKQGIFISVAGIMGMILQFGIPVLRAFAAFFLSLGAIGLFVSGIWKGIVYLVLKKGSRGY
jgi:hypothetical protein